MGDPFVPFHLDIVRRQEGVLLGYIRFIKGPYICRQLAQLPFLILAEGCLHGFRRAVQPTHHKRCNAPQNNSSQTRQPDKVQAPPVPCSG
ncbi:hypothetical protein D3C75_775450 [compost metagenome]